MHKFNAFIVTLFVTGLPLTTFSYFIVQCFKSTGNAMLFSMTVQISLGALFYFIFNILDQSENRVSSGNAIN